MPILIKNFNTNEKISELENNHLKKMINCTKIYYYAILHVYTGSLFSALLLHAPVLATVSTDEIKEIKLETLGIARVRNHMYLIYDLTKVPEGIGQCFSKFAIPSENNQKLNFEHRRLSTLLTMLSSLIF